MTGAHRMAVLYSETDLDDAREYDTPGNVALQLAMPDFEILEYVVLSGLLGALQDMVNSDSYEVFNKMAMHGDDASFQLGVVRYASLVCNLS